MEYIRRNRIRRPNEQNEPKREESDSDILDKRYYCRYEPFNAIKDASSAINPTGDLSIS